MSNCSNAGLLVVWKPFRRYIVRLRPTITFPLVVISCCIHQVSFHPLMTLHCYVLVQDIGFEPMTYTLEECCCYPTELILHMLYGYFAVIRHCRRTTKLVLHTSLELVAYGFVVRYSIRLS